MILDNQTTKPKKSWNDDYQFKQNTQKTKRK